RLAGADVAAASALLDTLQSRGVAGVSGAMALGHAPGASAAPPPPDPQAAFCGPLREHRVGYVFGALPARGAPWVIEAALGEQAQVHVVLPFPVEEFVAESARVRDAHPRNGEAGAAWRHRFEECLAKATSLTVLAQKSPPAREIAAAAYHDDRHAA